MDDAGLTSRIVVRRARPEELGVCADLYVRVLRETFTWTDPSRHRRDDFLRAAREEEVYLALDQGRLVGIAAVYAPQNFLHSLYVTERGRGIGRALLDHITERLDGPLSLKCQAANLRAQAFYEREGFLALAAGEDNGVAWIRYVRD
ncbi:MAG: GNAT family N-acetyltransferase [Pseudomonadota bacterium]